MTDEEMRAQGFMPATNPNLPAVPQLNEFSVQIAQNQAAIQAQIAQIQTNAAVMMKQIEAQLTAYQLQTKIQGSFEQGLGAMGGYVGNATYAFVTSRGADGSVETREEFAIHSDRSDIERERTERYRAQMNRDIEQIRKGVSFLDDPIGWFMGK